MNDQFINALQDANRRLCLEVEELRRRIDTSEEARLTEMEQEPNAVEVALERANCQKEEFLARLAHDLRNPLMPMQNAVELLRLPDTKAGQRQRAIDIIEGQVRVLRRLLDELLDFSRVTRGKIDLRKEPIELTALVARAVESSRPVIERRKHQLTVAPCAEQYWVNGDEARLTQVVSHLLDNAAKYTDEGGRIDVAVSGVDHEIELRVQDNGIGIDAQVLPNVFDLFAKSDRTLEHTRAGLGIGLTMVSKLVELHGGRVKALSAGRGLGSVFMVRLPRLSDADRVQAPPRESIMTLLGQPARRILIVSDSQEFGEEWGLLLRVAGHEVHVADSAAAALDAVRTFQPQVIFLNIGAGGQDADALARLLRDHTDKKNVMVIAIADDAKAESHRGADAASYDALLRKPAKIQDFLKLVASWDKC